MTVTYPVGCKHVTTCVVSLDAQLLPAMCLLCISSAALSQPIASSAISAMSKDVLAKCYGGDITRKKKLLQKQAKGKKRMKAMGKVSVPQEVRTTALQHPFILFQHGALNRVLLMGYTHTHLQLCLIVALIAQQHIHMQMRYPVRAARV